MRRTNKVRLTESQLNKVIKESVKQVLREHGYGNPARNNRIEQLRDTVQYVVENLKNHYDFYENDENLGYFYNGTAWCGRLFGYDSHFIDVLITNNYSRVGTDSPETAPHGLEGRGGIQVTGDIFDEYGTCLHNYVCACQGAPLGYMDRSLTPDELVKRLINDIEKCGLDDEYEEDEY